jgi:hypothetical protein
VEGPGTSGPGVRTTHAAGLAQTGLPGEITLVQAHGVRVAFVAFAPYADTEGATACHVSRREEYFLGEDRGNPQAFAHMAIRAGASLVIASGPRVLRGMQFYRHHLIAYSLANFASYNSFATSGDLGMSVILHVTLSAAGAFEHARIYPIQFTGHGQPLPGGGGISFVSQLSAHDFGASAARVLPSGAINPP